GASESPRQRVERAMPRGGASSSPPPFLARPVLLAVGLRRAVRRIVRDTAPEYGGNQMKRITIFIYGVVSYAVFFGTFCYSAGFLVNFGVPKSIDSPAAASIGEALAVNLGLLALFAVQHSVMARPGFKRWWTRIIPQPAERSTYVL